MTVTYRQDVVRGNRVFFKRAFFLTPIRWWAALLLAVVALATPVAAQREAGPIREDALTRFAAGVFLLEQGQAAAAVGPLEEAWRASEHHPVVGARLAQAYYAVRDLARADQVAGQVLAVDPSRIELHHMRARLALARGDLPGAIAAMEKARAARPTSLETERMLASLYAESGDSERALASIDRCIRIDPTIADLHVSRGEMLLDAGDAPGAEAAFREAMELDPLDPRAVEDLFDLYQVQSRKDEAITLLETYVSHRDAPAQARLKLAQAYVDAGRLPEAARVLEEGREGGQADDEAELLLGRIYFESGRYDDARRVFEPLYHRAGNSPELARIMGDLSLKTGDADAARRYFENAIAWKPDDYRSHLAFFFAASQRFAKDGARIELTPAEQKSLLARASSLAPRGDFDAQFAVGMACSSVDSLALARDHLQRANEIRPEQQPVLFNLASVHEKMGRYADAEAVLIELYALSPDDAAVCNFYGYLLALMNKELDRAEALVRRALAKEPENGYFTDSLGWVYYQRGDYARAVTELERALRLVGEDAVILEHLGDAYSALSRYRDALAAYQQSSRLQDGNPKLREKIQSTQRRLQ